MDIVQMRKQNLSYGEIARMVGHNKQYVKNYIRRNAPELINKGSGGGGQRLPLERSEIEQMLGQGYSKQQVAIIKGCSVQTIERRLER